jgi:hypothetical protein
MPQAKGLFATNPGGGYAASGGTGNLDGVVGGLMLKDNVVHIEFATATSVGISEMVGPHNTDMDELRWTGENYDDDQTVSCGMCARRGTFARLPRWGTLRTYGEGAFADMDAFVAATKDLVAGFGVSMYDPSAVAATLAAAYGMHTDVSRAVAFYVLCTPAFRGTGDTAVAITDYAYPASPHFNARRLPTYTASALAPTATFSMPWPWRGYTGTQPSGYFGDHVTGLPAVGNNTTSLPTVTIRASASGLPYLAVSQTAGKAWQIGGIPSAIASGTGAFFNGATLTADVIARLAASAAAIRYTAVSWVGCAFHSTASFASTQGQSFVWNGFYCTPASAGGPAVLSGITGTYIVWDFSQACATAMQSPSATVIANTGAVTNKNVLAWTPLPGTDAADRTTMHIFTLRIDNTVGGTNLAGSPANITEANADAWVALFQNGTRLARASTIASSTLYAAKSSAAGAYVLPNALLTSAVNGTSVFTTTNGAPHANASASVSVSATSWSFAESSVSSKPAAAHTDAEVVQIAAGLGAKWGIVPQLAPTQA